MPTRWVRRSPSPSRRSGWGSSPRSSAAIRRRHSCRSCRASPTCAGHRRLEPDVAVVVDAGDLARTGTVAAEHGEWLAKSRIVNIDHHVSNPGFGEANLVDPSAAATCEMVALLLPELGVALDEEMATALLAGIVQDTHTFAHPNATPRTLRVAAELVEAGADLSRINRAVYADKPFSTLALWGLMLAGIGQRCDGRIVFTSMTTAMLQQTGESPIIKGVSVLLSAVV